MARKPLGRRVEHVNMKLSLREGEDDDLLAFFASLAPRQRASAVKAALRSGGPLIAANADPDEADALNAALESFLE